jgi:hypothetical protein
MAHEICKKNGAKTQSKGETTMASVTQRFPRSARRFSRTVKHVSTLNQTVAAIFQRGLPASGHEMGHGDPDAPGVIERYGENFDLQTGSRSNFRSL